MIFTGRTFMQVAVCIATCKPLAWVLAATYTPTYTILPERALGDIALPLRPVGRAAAPH